MRVQSKTRGRRGAALLEMAIVLPFLAFLFIVVLDFCRVYNSTQTVQNCAFVGALYASGASQAEAGTLAADAAKRAAVAEGTKLNPPLRAENVTVSSGGGVVTVTVTHNFSMLTGFPGFGRTLTVARTVSMPVAPRVGE